MRRMQKEASQASLWQARTFISSSRELLSASFSLATSRAALSCATSLARPTTEAWVRSMAESCKRALLCSSTMRPTVPRQVRSAARAVSSMSVTSETLAWNDSMCWSEEDW